jgi:hypothetical protein
MFDAAFSCTLIYREVAIDAPAIWFCTSEAQERMCAHRAEG